MISKLKVVGAQSRLKSNINTKKHSSDVSFGNSIELSLKLNKGVKNLVRNGEEVKCLQAIMTEVKKLPMTVWRRSKFKRVPGTLSFAPTAIRINTVDSHGQEALQQLQLFDNLMHFAKVAGFKMDIKQDLNARFLGIPFTSFFGRLTGAKALAPKKYVKYVMSTLMENIREINPKIPNKLEYFGELSPQAQKMMKDIENKGPKRLLDKFLKPLTHVIRIKNMAMNGAVNVTANYTGGITKPGKIWQEAQALNKVISCLPKGSIFRRQGFKFYGPIGVFRSVTVQNPSKNVTGEIYHALKGTEIPCDFAVKAAKEPKLRLLGLPGTGFYGKLLDLPAIGRVNQVVASLREYTILNSPFRGPLFAEGLLREKSNIPETTTGILTWPAKAAKDTAEGIKTEFSNWRARVAERANQAKLEASPKDKQLTLFNKPKEVKNSEASPAWYKKVSDGIKSKATSAYRKFRNINE